MTRLPALAAVALAVASGLWLFASTFNFMDRGDLPYRPTILLDPLSAGHEVVQTFQAPENELSRVDILLNVPSHGGGDIAFELYDLGYGWEASRPPVLEKKVREVIVKPGFDNISLHRFSFGPIEDSRGRSYAIKLGGGMGGAPVQPRASEANAICANVYCDRLHLDGGLFIDGRPTDRDLVFELFHQDGAAGFFARIDPFRPFPLNRGFFFISLLLAASGSLGWLLAVVARP